MSLRNEALQELVAAPQERQLAVLERLCAKLRFDDGCWFWEAARDREGYGVFQLRRTVSQRAIRVMFALIHNRVPKVVRHTCDQPHCVNPAHLVDGTNKQNTQDMISRGRHPCTKPGWRPNARLTAQQHAEIRAAVTHGERQADLARRYAVDPSHISRIVRRERGAL